MRLRGALATAGGLTLACGGLGTPDAQLDPAEILRRGGDYAGAIALLEERLEANPEDAASWRLMGDVRLSRGQAYADRWKQNLKGALNAWAQSAGLAPENCGTWSRLAAGYAIAAPGEDTRAALAAIAELPDTDPACASGVRLALEVMSTPTDDAWQAAREALPAGASDPEILASAHPQLAARYAPFAEASADWSWLPVNETAPVAQGGWFSVLSVPARATGVQGATTRSFSRPGILEISSAQPDRLVFLDGQDTRYREARGRVKASACPGTTWFIHGSENMPQGYCTDRAWDPSASPVYDPALLVPTGTAHFELSKVSRAVIQDEPWREGSVRCVKGAVGRMIVDMPTCEVRYEVPIPVRRAVSPESGLPAHSREHARKRVEASEMRVIYGDGLADALSRGQVAVGMPYASFALSRHDLTGCQGKGLFFKTRLEGEQIDFACDFDDKTYSFEDMVLVGIADAD